MNTPPEATLEISFPKALLLSAFCMTFFVIGLMVIGVPMHDPLLIAFLAIMILGMTFAFAVCSIFMLRCKIDKDGLRPAAPTFYQRLLRWGDITSIRKSFGGPFYIVRGRDFGEFCALPRQFLLKRAQKLKELIEHYAPEGNIVRRKLTI